MSQPPIISICVANYNGMNVIDDCLQSIITQAGELAVEIIIHDDASSDRSVTHIRKHYPEVKLIESKKNVGFCIANNRMAETSHGEYLLLLNNDAALYSDALVTLHQAALEIGKPAILSLPQYDFDNGEMLDRGSLLDPFLNPTPNKNPQRGDVGMVMGACLWVPRSLWNELGGFPEWFGSIGEDLYLCCRARLAGYPVQAQNKSGYKHRIGTSFGGGKVSNGQLSTTRSRRALSERNKTFVMFICYPWPLALLLFCPHLMLLHIEGLTLSLVKRDLNIWREIYSPLFANLWRERYRLWSMRKEVQQQRRMTLACWLKPFRWLPWKIEMAIKHGVPEVR